jgi:hypothetical protein
VSKVHNKPIEKTKVGFKIVSKRHPERLPGLAHRTVRWHTGQCPVHQGTSLRTLQPRENPEPARYNSPDCPVYTGQCPVLQRDAALELASLGISRRLLRYNSSNMSGVHRTVRCILGATTISAPTTTCDALNARAARAEGRRAHTGAPDTEQFMSGAPPDIEAGPEVRTPTVRFQRLW